MLIRTARAVVLGCVIGALGLGACAQGSSGGTAAAPTATPEPVRPRGCHGDGSISSEYVMEGLKEPRTPLAAIKAQEKGLFTGPYAPQIVGYQIVEQSLPIDKNPSLRVVAWDSEGFARREYRLQRATAGGWALFTSQGCPAIPPFPRPTANDLA